MPVTTVMHEQEQNLPTHDDYINELIQEARAKTRRNWQVRERPRIPQRGWLGKLLLGEPKPYYKYELLVEVGGMLPFQIINFYRSFGPPQSVESPWSINLLVDADLVVAYLHGLLAGLEEEEKAKCPV